MNLVRKLFGRHRGRDIDLYTFSNDNGLVVSVTNFGAGITAIRTPDRNGRPGNIVFGYETLAAYVDDTAYVGGLIGRCANRISKARFQIDGVRYAVTANQGVHHLHGGREGFHKKIWEAEPVREERGCGLLLSLTSPDGEEGYPGTVDVQVRYLLTPDNALIAQYTAAGDKATIVNLTQHSYFNLAGGGTIHDHLLQINASGYTPVDRDLIPVGALKRVDATAFDFRSPRLLGPALSEARSGELVDGGYDHNFALDNSGDVIAFAATLYHPDSGRTVTIGTTQPGMHLYTANGIDGRLAGRNGQVLQKHGALCLQPQHFPDSPNQRAFPTVVLPAGRTYRQTTRYQFGLRS